jgi:hypothetical protein
MLIMAALWIVRKKALTADMKKAAADVGFIFLAGELALILGLVIAIIHPIWELNWRGLITLLGYLLILKGVIRLGWPHHSQKMIAKRTHGAMYWIALLIMVIIGIILTYFGFTNSWV